MTYYDTVRICYRLIFASVILENSEGEEWEKREREKERERRRYRKL